MSKTRSEIIRKVSDWHRKAIDTVQHWRRSPRYKAKSRMRFNAERARAFLWVIDNLDDPFRRGGSAFQSALTQVRDFISDNGGLDA